MLHSVASRPRYTHQSDFPAIPAFERMRKYIFLS
jgi:hypothetical protein